MEREILLLGNPKLYETSLAVEPSQLAQMAQLTVDLHDTLLAYRKKYGAGRAIAAPQIGVPLRVLYRHIGEPITLLNPVLHFPDEEQMEVLDDCMSFPGLKVRLLRYRRCVVSYRDLAWKECRMELEGDLSELLQHEYDHLDGILATMRARDNRSLYLM